ncbi:hypothetical protein V6N11_037558 [Hibiscus sabdariffa]|uniref:Uncharacterized protein n=2 Tax=Hibiscus sabdariffa TaxID=183260 RepID=A0ABR2P1W9_9ROSI
MAVAKPVIYADLSCDRVHRLYINKNGPTSYYDCLPGITYVIARIERKREDIEAPPVIPDTSVLGGGDSAHPNSLLSGDATHSHVPPHPHCSKSLISLLQKSSTSSSS